ncbi:MAG: hypothetical protein QM780_09930 [Hyphomicrobium sp.]|uniref:hypothetical protein n=1 Tax=Hyphomicrobium sp. TaxID=82 RepID=UPI0039E32F99
MVALGAGVVRHVIALKAREVPSLLCGADEIVRHFAEEFSVRDVACSYRDGEFRLRCEAAEGCDWMRLKDELTLLLSGERRRAAVSLVSVVAVLRLKGNGKGPTGARQVTSKE